jgi:hypothetical protein
MSDPKFQRPGTANPAGAAPQPPRQTAPARATAPAPGAPRPGTQPAHSPKPQTPAPRPAAGDPNARRLSSSGGRVTHDERGNAVWEWVTTATRQAILSATSLLRKLDSSELSLEETQPKDDKLALMPDKRPGGGFNPYEQANDKPRGRK